MPSIEYTHNNGDDYVTKRVTTDEQTAKVYGHIPYRQFQVALSDNQLVNDGTATETVTIKVVSGLNIVRGDSPTVLDYNGDMAVLVEDKEMTKTLTNGSVSFDLTTTKSAGSEIEIVAESLADHPAKSDSSSIEVVS